jgi:hypothetical protein
VIGKRVEADRGVVRALVARVASDYGARTVASDTELGSPGYVVRAPGAWADGGEGADLVVSVDPAASPRWEAYLAVLGKQARRALLVLARNAERPGQGSGPDTAALAEVLWRIGRVREHAYLGLPAILSTAPVVSVPAGRLIRKTARLHAFVVDTMPRTPQARRRLLAVE